MSWPPPRLPALTALLLSLCLGGCGSDAREVSIEITLGHEQDAFQQEPPVTGISIEALTVDGAVFSQAQTTPGGSFDLGEIDPVTPIRIEVTGFGPGGNTLVRGRSLTVSIGQLQSDLLPVFAQRLDQWARPPGGLDHAHVGGLGASLGERYVIHTGGDVVGGEPAAGTLAFYDMLSWTSPEGGVLTDVPTSLVVSAAGDEALFVSANKAVWVSFAGADEIELDPPQGLNTFAAVAGGKAVRGNDSSYLVGATRSDAPSDQILIVHDDFSLSVATLTQPRQGAAASWIDDVGLVIAGGSDEGAGIEVLAAEATEALPRPFPADATIGAAASIDVQPGHLLLAGGTLQGADPGVRRIDLSCSTDCMPIPLDSQLPVALADATAFAWSGGDLLVLGTSADDALQHCYRLSTTSDEVIELPLREPRTGAAVVPAPNGTLALIGGALADGSPALTIETLFPD